MQIPGAQYHKEQALFKNMISVVIIEDDFISADFLVSLLNEHSDSIEVRTVLGSVSEAVEFFQNQ